MANNLSHNETLLAQQLDRDQASVFLDLETAWACALAVCLLNPRADLRKSDLQRRGSSFSRIDDKTFQAIAVRITIEQMENVGHSITEAATRLSPDQLQALEQGWSKINNFRLRQIAGKALAH